MTSPADLAAADLDVLVVGGGIVGAGAALDAVTRGLRVGLVEAGDWGGERSGHTSTVVHGGLVDLTRIGVGAVAALRLRSTASAAQDTNAESAAPGSGSSATAATPTSGWSVKKPSIPNSR